ncbi:MAG: hypothetical protein D6710_12005 [Nitrospirae bacterium]|nr:MAG: hypothetical protein D6710_12005 [Nitrospirota bacterium]
MKSDNDKEKKELQPFKESVGGHFLAKHAEDAGVTIPADKLSIIHGFMDRAKFGHQAALPMVCRGNKCPLINVCPLKEAGLDLPVGKKCPVEKSVIEQWVFRTMESLDIDPDDPEYAVDMDMVYELAGIELLRMRLAASLAEEPDVYREKIVGYSPQGDPIYDDKPNMSLLLLEKYSKVVAKLRDQLVATRKSQAQVGKLAGDKSVRSANILEKAKRIAERRASSRDIEDAEIIEVKDDEEQEGSGQQSEGDIPLL